MSTNIEVTSIENPQVFIKKRHAASGVCATSTAKQMLTVGSCSKLHIRYINRVQYNKNIRFIRLYNELLNMAIHVSYRRLSVLINVVNK